MTVGARKKAGGNGKPFPGGKAKPHTGGGRKAKPYAGGRPKAKPHVGGGR